ncbi:MAG: flagellar hook-basal body complex protein [Rhodospirillaceae bacterium]
MTIEGATSAALNGMNANANVIGYISDNLANVSTPGFKRIDARFSDIASEMQGSESNYSNPQSVRVTPRYRVDFSGTFAMTDNPTGFAVAKGEGLIPVRQFTNMTGTPVIGTEPHYTRAGDFKLDVTGYLVNSQNQALMGIPEVTPFSGEFAAAPTVDSLIPIRVNNEENRTMPGVASGTIAVNINLPGSITPSPDPSSPGGLPAKQDPNDQNFLIPFFDSNGSEHTLEMTFRRMSSAANIAQGSTGNATSWWAAVGATVQDTPPTTITMTPPYSGIGFDQNGSLATKTLLNFALPPLQGGGELPTLNVDFGVPKSRSTQYSAARIEVRDVNDPVGHSPGIFTSAEMDANGHVVFHYSNGRTAPPFRVPLATFPNADLLERVTGSTFGENPKLAGAATYSWGGEGSVGQIVPKGTETSNVDLASELVKLISAQRAYSCNSKVISTADTMTETAITLKG